jgi:hypothetical protein
VKNNTFARVVLCLAVLVLASATLFAQTVPGVITINGGKNTVALKAPTKTATIPHKEPAGNFYTDFTSGSSPYICNVGYTISDGSPINTEYTSASQFVSKKTGTTTAIRIAVGFVAGTNGANVVLDKDCAGVPCGTVDKTNLCKGTISNLPVFGQSCTQIERMKCTAKLVKNHKYWVYVQSPANTWDAWNLANTATGTTAESTNDGAWVAGSGGSLGAFAVR